MVLSIVNQDLCTRDYQDPSFLLYLARNMGLAAWKSPGQDHDRQEPLRVRQVYLLLMTCPIHPGAITDGPSGEIFHGWVSMLNSTTRKRERFETGDSSLGRHGKE